MAITNAKYFIPKDHPMARSVKLCGLVHWLLSADPRDRRFFSVVHARTLLVVNVFSSPTNNLVSKSKGLTTNYRVLVGFKGSGIFGGEFLP